MKRANPVISRFSTVEKRLIAVFTRFATDFPRAIVGAAVYSFYAPHAKRARKPRNDSLLNFFIQILMKKLKRDPLQGLRALRQGYLRASRALYRALYALRALQYQAIYALRALLY